MATRPALDKGFGGTGRRYNFSYGEGPENVAAPRIRRFFGFFFGFLMGKLIFEIFLGY